MNILTPLNAISTVANCTGHSNCSLPPTVHQALSILSPHYRHAWLIWIACTLITCIFGTLANGVLLTVTIVYKKIRDSSSSALIVHSIIVDLYISAVVAPVISILGYLGPQYRLPDQFCRFFGLGFYGLYYVHVWAGCVLAFQRLLATCWPMSYAKFTKKPVLICMIIFPWAMSISISIFPMFNFGTKIVQSSLAGGCTLVTSGHNVSILNSFALYFPSVLMGLFYIVLLTRTLLVLREKTSQGKAGYLLQRRLEISCMLFVSFLWFCVSMYPLTLVLAFFPRQFNTNIALHLVPRYLTASYSCLNPVTIFPTFIQCSVRHFK